MKVSVRVREDKRRIAEIIQLARYGLQSGALASGVGLSRQKDFRRLKWLVAQSFKRGLLHSCKKVRGKAILKQTAQGVWSMGKLLCEAKELLPHGSFGNWIDAEFGLSSDTAQNFMRVFLAFEKPNFSVFAVAPSVLYELAKPSVSDETREVAIELAASGDLKSTSDAKSIIDAAKPAPAPAENHAQFEVLQCGSLAPDLFNIMADLTSLKS